MEKATTSRQYHVKLVEQVAPFFQPCPWILWNVGSIHYHTLLYTTLTWKRVYTCTYPIHECMGTSKPRRVVKQIQVQALGCMSKSCRYATNTSVWPWSSLHVYCPLINSWNVQNAESDWGICTTYRFKPTTFVTQHCFGNLTNINTPLHVSIPFAWPLLFGALLDVWIHACTHVRHLDLGCCMVCVGQTKGASRASSARGGFY